MARKPKKRSPGRGRVYRRGNTWWIQWRDKDKNRHWDKFTTKDLAEEALAKKLDDVERGRAGLEVEAPAPPPTPTLGELADAWIDRREKAGNIRSWRDDRSRWNAHLKATFGHCRPAEVGRALIRRFVEQKLAEGLAPTSIKHALVTLSGLYVDADEQGHADKNPCHRLPPSLRRMLRARHDPKQTPYIEKAADVARVYRVLPQPWATLYAITALAGLRPGEALALEWRDVDLAARRLHVERQVRHGRVGLPKSGKTRIVPMIPALARILAEHKLATGGEGKLFPSANAARGGKRGTEGKYLDPVVMSRKLRDALKACGLPEITWYQAGRHTFASQHALADKSMAKLREIMGHCSVVVTERYAHLSPGAFKDEDLMPFEHDMSRDGGEVIELRPHRSEEPDGAACADG
jgi:integrase